MKKFVSILLVLVLSLMMCASAMASRLDDILAAGEIHLATSPDFAPIEFIDDTKTGQDQYVGADIELAKYIAEKLNVKLVIDAMDFAAVQAAAAMGKTDMAISGFAYTPERAEVAEMSIYFNITDETDMGQTLLVPKGTEDKFNTAEDFAGLTIAVQNGSLQQQLAAAQLPESCTLKPIADLGTAVMMLTSGKVDAIGVDGSNGDMFCKNNPEVALANFKYDFEGEGNVLMVPKGETELIEAINEILKEVNELGLYQQWKDEATKLATSLGIDVNE